jgi:hypothetical protein
MARLSPQVLVQFARNAVHKELKWKPTAQHAPPIPDGAVTDDPLAALGTLDVRLLQQLGFRAYYDETAKESAWPLPLGMSPHELALFGADCGILYEHPEIGDIFLQRSFRIKEYIHAGLVMTVDGQGCIDDHTVYYDNSTIEGDTDHRGLLGRGYTCKLRRRLSPTLGDRFLRWSELNVSGKVA